MRLIGSWKLHDTSHSPYKLQLTFTIAAAFSKVLIAFFKTLQIPLNEESHVFDQATLKYSSQM